MSVGWLFGAERSPRARSRHSHVVAKWHDRPNDIFRIWAKADELDRLGNGQHGENTPSIFGADGVQFHVPGLASCDANASWTPCKSRNARHMNGA